tara:strand:- start:119 stop:325 length:207 start_codon:yes stop_codon:yes gene_type:complete
VNDTTFQARQIITMLDTIRYQADKVKTHDDETKVLLAYQRSTLARIRKDVGALIDDLDSNYPWGKEEV